jgi:glyoxylase-like metal-dependent hydrolase (beta-lactamase superfamily II)
MNNGSAFQQIGQATVARIFEISATFPASKLLPDFDPALVRPDPANRSPSDPEGSQLNVSIHSWLVRIGNLTVLIDAGIGNGKRRSSKLFDHLATPWLDRLAAAGARPEDVTHVLLTHLHIDHVGWNTIPGNGGWAPTFPNARTYLPRRGYELFMSLEGRARPNYDMFADSVLPVIAAGRAEFVSPEGGEVLAGFTYLPTPGHSPDHMSILLNSDGQEALFAGDVLHNPVQVTHPDWCSMYCESHEEARRSRQRMLELAADRNIPWFSSHCAETSIGTVSRDGDHFAWTFR